MLAKLTGSGNYLLLSFEQCLLLSFCAFRGSHAQSLAHTAVAALHPVGHLQPCINNPDLPQEGHCLFISRFHFNSDETIS